MTVQEELEKTEALLEIVKAHSGREQVELTDLLDDLGLDSLDFVALLQNVEHDFNIEIPMKDYSRIETVRDLRERI